MLHFTAILLLFVSVVFSVSGYATELNPVTMITLINTNNQSSLATTDQSVLIKKAYKSLLSMDKQTLKILEIAARALSEGPTAEADAEFQRKKYRIEKELLKQTLVLGAFGYQELYFRIYDHRQHRSLAFYLNSLTADATSLSFTTSILTSTEAKAALVALQNILGRIDLMLPSDDSAEALNQFVGPMNFESQAGKNQIILQRKKDGDALIKALVQLKQAINADLNDLVRLVQLVLTTNPSEAELNKLESEYETKTRAFYYNVASNHYQLKTDIPLFHDIQFTIQLPQQVKKYFFPTIDLVSLELDTDNLLDIVTAVATYRHLILAYEWSKLWAVTGQSQLFDVDNELSSNDFLKNNLPSLSIPHD